MIRKVVACVLAALTVSAVGCAREQQVRERVLGYLATTENLPRTLEYTEEISGSKIQVSGRIQDALRYRETVKLDGAPVLEQVVSDDAMAVRVIDPGKLPLFAEGSPLLDSSPILTDSLRAGTWVLDPSGAPPLRKTAPNPEEFQVSDPLRDPIEALQYVRLAIDTAADVKQWREDDIAPAYRRSEDHFPPPALKEQERRYDLVRPALPNLNRPANSPGRVDPSIFHFRKMAIYVRSDRIVKVLEEISVDDHPEVKEAVEKKRQRVLDLIEALKEGKSREKVRFRKMSIAFKDLGSKLAVTTPTDALKASLDSLFQMAPQGTLNIFGFGVHQGSMGPQTPGEPQGGTSSPDGSSGTTPTASDGPQPQPPTGS